VTSPFVAHTSGQTILWNTIPLEAKGDGDLLGCLGTKNTKTGETSDLAINGLFYAIGHEPATSLIRGQVDTDSDGYIITVPGTTTTNVKGVFAAGDVQDKRYRQAITSAGSGASRSPDVIVDLDSDSHSFEFRLHGCVGG
jgi:thioredoxin reductase (NADPH)